MPLKRALRTNRRLTEVVLAAPAVVAYSGRQRLTRSPVAPPAVLAEINAPRLTESFMAASAVFAHFNLVRAIGLAVVTAALLAVSSPLLADEHATREAPAVLEISRAALVERRAQQGNQNLTLLDVRTTEEFAAGHVPGAINIPLDQLATRLVELSSTHEIVVYCLSGVRSAQAIDLLRGREFPRVEHLTGDFAEWQSSGGVVETSTP